MNKWEHMLHKITLLGVKHKTYIHNSMLYLSQQYKFTVTQLKTHYNAPIISFCLLS